MKHFIIGLALLTFSSGCSLLPATEPESPEVQAARAAAEEERKNKILEATLTDGVDERCYTFFSIEFFCAERKRDTTSPVTTED